MAHRQVWAEGSSKPISREVKFHHEARVAIMVDNRLLELTENGYGDWRLVERGVGMRDDTILAEGSLGTPVPDAS